MSVNNSQSFPKLFSGSFILFFSGWEITQDGIMNSSEVWTNLSVEKFKPLINTGGLGGVSSVHFSSFSGEVSHDWVWFEDTSFWGFQGWNFSHWVFFQILSGFPFGKWKSNEFNVEVEESQKDFNLGTSSDGVDWVVKFQWHWICWINYKWIKEFLDMK